MVEVFQCDNSQSMSTKHRKFEKYILNIKLKFKPQHLLAIRLHDYISMCPFIKWISFHWASEMQVEFGIKTALSIHCALYSACLSLQIEFAYFKDKQITLFPHNYCFVFKLRELQKNSIILSR